MLPADIKHAQREIEDLKKRLNEMTTNYKNSKNQNKLLVKSLNNYKKQKSEDEVRSLVSNVLTKNQLDLIFKKKKKGYMDN